MKAKRIDKKMLAVIFTLGWPTMLDQFLQTAVSYIDTAMVGSLGTEATAAVGATGTVSWLIMGMINAIGVGFLAVIAQAIGAGDRDRARRAGAQTVLVTLCVGIALTVILLSLAFRIPVWMQVDPHIRFQAGRYFFILYTPMLFRTAMLLFGNVLRAVGDTKTPMRMGLIVNGVNVVLNFLLIYPTRTVSLFGLTVPVWGANLGVDGAAAASAASFVAGGLAMTAALFRHPEISPKGLSIAPDGDILRPCLRIAVPNLMQRFATSMGYVVFAAMINALGGLSTAAHSIANTVESAFYIPGYGMQAAAATLSGQALGAKDEKKADALLRAIVPLEIGLMLISGGLLFAFAQPLMHIFSRDAAVIALGATVLKMVAVSEPFYGVPIVVEGLMQGMGKTIAPFIFNVSGMWGVRIVGTYICTVLLGMGLVSAWACMIAHNLVLFVLFCILIGTGRWKPEKARWQ